MSNPIKIKAEEKEEITNVQTKEVVKESEIINKTNVENIDKEEKPMEAIA